MSKTLSLGIAATLVTGTSAALASDSSDRAPVVYVIPMSGQMGTDIHPAIYEDVIKDANKVKPDLVIFQLDSADIDNNNHIQNDDRREMGIWGNIEVYRDLMMDLQTQLPVDKSAAINGNVLAAVNALAERVQILD